MSRVAVIQAHMGSTRLPGKILKDIHGGSMLDRVIERAKSAKQLVIVATPDDLDSSIQSTGIRLHRSKHDADVLSRYYEAITKTNAETSQICRITSDCPLVDPATIKHAFRVLETTGVDLVGYQIQTSINSSGLPDGFDVEVFTLNALYRAHSNAKEAYEREHVTTWMRRHLDCITIRPGKKYPVVKLSVDTQEDLDRVRQVYKAMLWHKPDFSVDDVGLYLRGLEDAMDK